MTYTHPDYPDFIFTKLRDRGTGPLGAVCDYEIISAPEELQTEVGCWLRLLSSQMSQK
tara:strand:- start:715 stop:888 length:174 start_codon:yes stop_codon:yes gene_type:complete